MPAASPTNPNPSPPDGNESATETETTPPTPAEPDPNADTFPRVYVEDLRTEAATHRTTARDATARAETLAATLTTELVRATGRLADPTDLPYDAAVLTDGIPDPALIAAAIDDLLTRKPHLGDRRPTGSVDQGARATGGGFTLADALRIGAG